MRSLEVGVDDDGSLGVIASCRSANAALLVGARTLRADASGVLGGAINAGGDCGINSPQPNACGSFMDAAGLNQGGNKADNIGRPKASAPAKCASFPAVGPCE